MMNAYVTYNAQYKVLICREHKYGIAPDYVLRHLRDYHKGVPLATRNAIVNYSKTLDLAVPENIIVPVGIVHPIEGLTVVDGYQCTYHDCSELRGTDTSIKEHCKREHRWLTITGTTWKKQAIQTIFDGSRRRYSSNKLLLTVGSFQLLHPMPLLHCHSRISLPPPSTVLPS